MKSTNLMRAISLALVFSVLASAQQASRQATVVANSIDLAANADNLQALRSDGINVTEVSAFDFPDHQSDPLIIILGGQHAPEGVGALVDTILEQKEKDELIATPNAMTVRIWPNLWAQNQNVLLFAGNEKEQTARVFADSEPALLKILKSDNPTQIANLSTANANSTQGTPDYSQLRVC